jgi:predicted DsbA family dithiol-disulfide isomerase
VREFTAYHLQHRVAAEGATGLPYHVPRVSHQYPRGSSWALEAAKWVGKHHPDRLEDFDLAVFRAFFQETLDISNPKLLSMLAAAHGLDGDALAASLEAHEHRADVVADHQQAIALGVQSVPAVFIGSTQLCGAVPYDEYVQALREELAARTRRRARRVASR